MRSWNWGRRRVSGGRALGQKALRRNEGADRSWGQTGSRLAVFLRKCTAPFAAMRSLGRPPSRFLTSPWQEEDAGPAVVLDLTSQVQPSVSVSPPWG